ncbi:hypothetical protein FF011L_24400 [Roseimaritima multifibrata]|uniref:Uncharacterized protein n=1 Tax=Roseimaritima multifibrata TaxID=1930274 RepID=A0A517MFY0_9BACT|nr:hypothetical protein FF011L_24400 [Roseimaritima multifibrata]
MLAAQQPFYSETVTYKFDVPAKERPRKATFTKRKATNFLRVRLKVQSSIPLALLFGRLDPIGRPA